MIAANVSDDRRYTLVAITTKAMQPPNEKQGMRI
jgi:hypothetical protein